MQILHLTGSHGTGRLPAVHRLIAGNHHLLHLGHLLMQGDINLLLSGIGHLLRFHSDKRIDDFHRITFEDGKLIVTIDIGRSTNVRVTDEDRYSR